MKILHPTGVVTLVFTDIEGSSALWEQHRDAFAPLLEEHNVLLRGLIVARGGQEIRHQGDGFFLSFARATAAVLFALDAQRAIKNHDWQIGGQTVPFLIRIGMHSGEAQAMFHPSGAPDYYGASVNRAARVSGAGWGGQILVSHATWLLSQAELGDSINFLDLGVHRMKGVGQERLWQVSAPDLPDKFPPPNTLDAQRHNLPLPATPFVGRERELEIWRERLLMPATRLLTIVGFGGIGKTRAALQLAESCLPDFPDGVWWVDLAEARDGDAMIQRIAYALNFWIQTPPTAHEQVTRLLRPQKSLLILDNLEQIADAGDVVRDLLEQASHIKIVATSRRALELQTENIAEAPPLPPETAQLLFVERARARRADFAVTDENRADIARLCENLEGMPLAIELAASRLVALSPREIATRLSQRLQVLQSRAPDLPPRQRALRAVIDWSHDLLRTPDRVLLAALSAFAGGFALEDAEAICQRANLGCDALEGVTELRRQSLLRAIVEDQTQHTRYFLLEAVREYAVEKLAENATICENVREAHAIYFADLARSRMNQLRTPDEMRALRAFESDIGNSSAALDWSSARSDEGATERAANLALSLGTFLGRCGFGAEAARRIEQALQLVPQSAPLRAEIWRERASLWIDEKQTALAFNAAQTALNEAQNADDAVGVAAAHNLLGLCARAQNDWPRARTEFGAALQSFEALELRALAANVHNNLGIVEREAPGGQSEKVTRHWELALAARKAAGDARGLSETLNNLGVMAQEQGQLDAAWRYGAQALQIKVELGHIAGTAATLFNLSEIAEARADLKFAARLSAAAQSLFDKSGSPHAATATAWLHSVATRAGHNEKSLQALQRRLKEMTFADLVNWALERNV